MTVSEDMARHLASKGLGTLGTNIGPEMPALPDDFLAVREYAGRPPEHSKSGGPHVRRPRFQVTARSKSARAAMLRAEDAFGHLSGLRGIVNGTAYSKVVALGDPFPIGRDDGGRERVVCNFEATK